MDLSIPVFSGPKKHFSIRVVNPGDSTVPFSVLAVQ
jgi:hypothetical protein